MGAISKTILPAAARCGLPVVTAVLALGLWELAVRVQHVPVFVLPPPSAIFRSLATDFPLLAASALVTLRIAAAAFAIALICGVATAIVFAQSRIIELALAPYALMLQVTPFIAIAPLIIIWVGDGHAERALLILASMVGFFPILSGTLLGFRSLDPQLGDLFTLYGANPWQRFVWLRFPAALPHLLAAMKVSAGLSLIGCIAAEFVAGSGATQGLAWRIIEAGNRLLIARMFACVVLLAVIGITVYYTLTLLEYLLLRRWHASYTSRSR